MTLVLHVGIHNTITVFTHANTPILCKNFTANTFSKDSCNVTKLNYCDSECDLYFNFTGITSTVTSDFNLICSQSYALTISECLYFVGLSAGAAIGGFISDTYGRKSVIVWSGFLAAILTILTGLSKHWQIYMILKILTGITLNAGYIGAFVMCVEAVGKNYRSICGIWVQGFFAFGVMLCSFTAYFFRDWRNLQLATAVYSIPVPVLLVLYFHDSSRYYFFKGLKDQLRNSLKFVIKWNGISSTKTNDEIEKFVDLSGETKVSDNHTVLSLFKHSREMTLITLNIMLNWFANATCYYGLTLGVASLPVNLYLGLFLSALMEWPSYLITSKIMEIRLLGRRGSLSGLLILAGLSCATTVLLVELAGCDKENLKEVYHLFFNR